MTHHALPQSYPDLSCIIVSHNSRYLVQQCIDRLHAVLQAIRYEILIVENGQTTPCRIADFSPLPNGQTIRLFSIRRNRGFGSANNVAIGRANAPLVLLLNPDILLTERTVPILVREVETRPNAAILAPKLLNVDGTPQQNCRSFPTHATPLYQRTFLQKTAWGHKEQKKFRDLWSNANTPIRVPWALGSCLLARTSFLTEVRGFDERYFMYYEDTDLCRTAWAHGKEVWYIPHAQAYHFHGRYSRNKNSFTALFNPYTRTHIRSHLLYMRKWRNAVLPALLRPTSGGY